MRRALGILTVLLLVACGRRGDPLPPIVEVPETTTDLVAVQVEDRVVLTWSYPKLTRAGNPLPPHLRVEIWRLAVPPGQEAVGARPGGEDLRRQLMLRRGELVARLDGAALEQATRGASLRYADPLPPVATAGAPETLWFAVRSRTPDGPPSALSNIAALLPRVAPPPPEGLAATAGPSGIALSWTARPGLSYTIERRPAGGAEWARVATSVEAASHLDPAPQGATWQYRVRARTDSVTGAPGQPVEIAHPDVYPPPVVPSLLCLPETDKVRLRWQAPPEAGVRYKVFRQTAGDRGWDHLEEDTPSTEFVDLQPPAGELTYAVKAFDAAFNQSDAVYCTVRTGP